MMERESGIVRCNAWPSERIEAFARLAYTLGGMSTRRPKGTGALLEQMVEPSTRICLVEVGMRRREAIVSFRDDDDDSRTKSSIDTVRIGVRQSPEDLSIACAMACARIVEWVRFERWPPPLLRSVTLAIAMPIPIFLLEMGQMTANDLASAYVVPSDCVLERAHMLRKGRDTGTHEAITAFALEAAKIVDRSP